MSYDPCHICGACAIKTDGQGRHVCERHVFGEALPLPSKLTRLHAAVATLGALGFADAPLMMPRSRSDMRRFVCVECGCRIGEGRAGRKCKQCREALPIGDGSVSIEINGEFVKVRDVVGDAA